MFKRAPRLNQRLVFHVVNYDNYYLTWLILCVCFQTSPRSHWSVQHCKAHPSWWEIGISSTERKGHLALGIKCWRPGTFHKCWFSSWDSFPASFSSVLVRPSSRDPKILIFVGLFCLQSGNPELHLLGWGAGPTPGHIHSIFFGGQKSLAWCGSEHPHFPPFPPKKSLSFQFFQYFPLSLTHWIWEFSPFPTADVPSKP